jgi:hypothetical protein
VTFGTTNPTTLLPRTYKPRVVGLVRVGQFPLLSYTYGAPDEFVICLLHSGCVWSESGESGAGRFIPTFFRMKLLYFVLGRLNSATLFFSCGIILTPFNTVKSSVHVSVAHSSGVHMIHKRSREIQPIF